MYDVYCTGNKTIPGEKNYFIGFIYLVDVIIGVLDNLVGSVFTFMGGIFSFIGANYCDNNRILIIVGHLGHGFWACYCMTCVILAINRCIEMNSRRTAETLFNGNRVWIWMIAPLVYGIIFSSSLDLPPIYNSVWSVYMFQIDWQPGAPLLVTDWTCFLNSCWVMCALIILYSILLFSLKCRTEKYVSDEFGESKRISNMQKKVMIHYAAAGFIKIPPELAKFATIAIQMCSGFTSIVYLAINKTIRKGVVRLIYNIAKLPSEESNLDYLNLKSTFSESNNKGQQCLKRWVPQSSSFVCVCNADYCDKIQPVDVAEVQNGNVVYYTTDKEQHRLYKQTTRFNDENDQNIGKNIDRIELVVDAAKTYQSIFGFGAAFTDSAGISLNALSEKTRNYLLRSYFDKQTGINYNVGRVPMASCDFSTHEYSYLDKQDDFSLESFALAPEDLELKITHLLKAMNYSQNQLQLFASPWSAPGWMKTNGRMKDGYPLKGEINGKYYETYAKYFKRFFEEYFAHGVKFWGLSIQNEPFKGEWPWQCMDFDFATQREFAHKLLVPALKSSKITADLKVMGCEDTREALINAANELYGDPEKANYIDGLAVQWYNHSDFDVLSEAHDIRPDKFIFATEACTGYLAHERGPILGDWHRGAMYAHDIMNNLKNWVVGWTDWNLCLDTQGGPNWVGNYVDSPIIVNASGDEFYKQPMFYAMAHFSKFIPRDSVHISSTLSFVSDPDVGNVIDHIAFETPEGEHVLVLTNLNDTLSKTVEVVIKDTNLHGKVAKIIMYPNSVITAIWSSIK
uniref:Glucosylceramidase n=1 Tax=Ditylenchus dipsaci TaxID=166011 RepID=A0A915D9Z5_9BILA